MTTTESLFALKLILEANWAYSNFANGESGPKMDDDQLAEATRLFEGIVGQHVAQRLSDWFMDSHASAQDGFDVAADATELMKLAAIIGLTQ